MLQSDPNRVIVVDDEPDIRSMVADYLGRDGSTAASAKKIAARPEGYDALVCDLRMPDIDGPRLFGWVSSNHPALAERTLFVTGGALGPVAGRFLATSVRPVIEKPFAPADMVCIVSEFAPRNAAPHG